MEATPQEWSEYLSQVQYNVATRLTIITADIADLQAFANDIFSLPAHVIASNEVSSILARALAIEQRLSEWASTLPDDWQSQPAADTSPSTLYKFQAYSANMDIYYDVWVASIRNSFRSQCITIQIMIINCLDRELVLMAEERFYETQSHSMAIQRTVDEICSSVPFHLGDSTSTEIDAKVNYPWIQGFPAPLNHRRAAAALGGWFLL